MEGIETSKQYSLRWEKHAFNLASEAGCFFEDESFLDCTLSAEGQCIDAHKIILSASSSYLSNLLKIMPDKHPIIIFNDIKFDQLKSLVAFIYNGSVNVSENNIHAFLNAAQSLLIKGLSEETKEDERNVENNKRQHSNVTEIKSNHRKPNSRASIAKKSEIYLDAGKSFKKLRQILPKSDGSGNFVECEESLSKLQEISFTKYINQNLNSKPHGRNVEILESKWIDPAVEEKLRSSENYVVKSWRHNSLEDLNGRHKPNKINVLKKIKLEKPTANDLEESDRGEKVKSSTPSTDLVQPQGHNHRHLQHQQQHHSERSKSEGKSDEKIKRESDSEQILLVEPKQEMAEESEDGNSEEFDSLQNVNNETVAPDSDSIYEGRSGSNFYQQPVIDRGVPVPLLLCRTSLSEPESIEPNWMPQIAGNPKSDHIPHANPTENNSQDVQCRTCSQDLPCPTCTKKYKSRYALNRHILYECGKARKSFSCDECGKKVTRQDTLQKHKLIHLVQHLKKKETETDEESPNPKKMC